MFRKNRYVIFCLPTDQRRATCWTQVRGESCEMGLGRPLTKAECCTVGIGKAWGSPCEHCPTETGRERGRER